MLDPIISDLIVDLFERKRGIRGIAKKLHLTEREVRQVLRNAGHEVPAYKSKSNAYKHPKMDLAAVHQLDESDYNRRANRILAEEGEAGLRLLRRQG